MSELIVMHKDGGRMNVPPAKFEEYLEAGWTEIERVPMSDSIPSPTPAEPEKPKGKGKGKAKVVPEPEEAEVD
jgi:hypothetical protein